MERQLNQAAARLGVAGDVDATSGKFGGMKSFAHGMAPVAATTLAVVIGGVLASM